MNDYRPAYPAFGPWKKKWARFWMRFAGAEPLGRCATRLAAWAAPPQHKDGPFLAEMCPRGFISPSAILYHKDLSLGANVFIGDRVLIYQRKAGGAVRIGDKSRIYRDTIIETDRNGSLTIGERSSIHPRGQINAYVEPIRIGSGVMIAPNCALYSYNHGVAPNLPIRKQPLESNGPIVIEDDAWLGVNVTVLSGVRIGRGAIIGANSLVTKDIPDGAIATGVPARVVKMRSEIAGIVPSRVPLTVSEGETQAVNADAE
jgi:acetyltransferase-like isoleucine patch superfamily enzyme